MAIQKFTTRKYQQIQPILLGCYIIVYCNYQEGTIARIQYRRRSKSSKNKWLKKVHTVTDKTSIKDLEHVILTLNDVNKSCKGVGKNLLSNERFCAWEEIEVAIAVIQHEIETKQSNIFEY